MYSICQVGLLLCISAPKIGHHCGSKTDRNGGPGPGHAAARSTLRSTLAKRLQHGQEENSKRRKSVSLTHLQNLGARAACSTLAASHPRHQETTNNLSLPRGRIYATNTHTRHTDPLSDCRRRQPDTTTRRQAPAVIVATHATQLSSRHVMQWCGAVGGST